MKKRSKMRIYSLITFINITNQNILINKIQKEHTADSKNMQNSMYTCKVKDRNCKTICVLNISQLKLIVDKNN